MIIIYESSMRYLQFHSHPMSSSLLTGNEEKNSEAMEQVSARKSGKRGCIAYDDQWGEYRGETLHMADASAPSTHRADGTMQKSIGL